MFPEHSTGNFPMHNELSIFGTKEMYNMEKIRPVWISLLAQASLYWLLAGEVVYYHQNHKNVAG